MRKALVFAALAAAIMSNSAQAQDWSLQTSGMEKSVFRLQSNEGYCSAILINEKDNILLSAAHCIPKVEEGRSITVNTKHAEVLKLNTVLDLALLKVKELKGTQAVLHEGPLRAGTPVAVVGFGLAARSLKFGFGWVSDQRDASIEAAGDSLYFVVVGVVPGDSGGALFDATGKLVSVVQGGIGNGPYMLGLGAPTEVIDDFVKPHWPNKP